MNTRKRQIRVHFYLHPEKIHHLIEKNIRLMFDRRPTVAINAFEKKVYNVPFLFKTEMETVKIFSRAQVHTLYKYSLQLVQRERS